MKDSKQGNNIQRSYKIQKTVLRNLGIEFGDLILEMNYIFQDKMNLMSDEPISVDSDDPHEFAGFIMKENKSFGVSIMADIHALSTSKAPTLRLGAVQVKDYNGNEQFNSMSFFFQVDPTVALRVAKKKDKITRDDLRDVLHRADTWLENMTISDNSGFDEGLKKPFGTFYPLDAVASEAEYAELGEVLQDYRTKTSVSVEKIEKVLRDDIYPRLKSAVQDEAQL